MPEPFDFDKYEHDETITLTVEEFSRRYIVPLLEASERRFVEFMAEQWKGFQNAQVSGDEAKKAVPEQPARRLRNAKRNRRNEGK